MEGLCINSSIQGITPTNTIQATGVVARMTTALVRTFHRGAMITTKSGGVTTEASSISLRPIEESVESEEEFGFEVEQIERLKLNQKKENWVMKILRVGMLWREKEEEIQDEVEEKEEQIQEDDDNSSCSGCDEEFCSVVDDIEQIEFDKKSFSGLLKRVSLMDAKLYAKMSYLGILAYQVSKIKSENLLTHQDLHFVTSSLEKREQMKTKEDDTKKQTGIQQIERDETDEEAIMRKNSRMINAQTAYQIAASAASYLHSHTKTILPFRSKKTGTIEDSPSINEDGTLIKGSSKVASVLATTNSVTAVVAAKEEVKKAVAKDLNSSRSSPCDWFICDNDTIGTRFFVIQGSETLASWQANLLFEPIQFEGLDVLVHRGIYEAAKGIYEQMLPEVRSHLNSRKSSTLRFTGHSLGGSLALLINLMLLIRGEAPISSLLPVITFGAPSIMCGGDQLLRKLGLPKSHVRAISMHRDIVPRAFSCSYPNHVAEILKAVNGNFRKHPCLKNQKLLYSPMGQLLILQPDESFSPHHPLLPSGSGLYHLGHSLSSSSSRSRKRVRAAQVKFLNSPHPLEILSGPSAYGSDGTIYRDHDMNSYFLSVNCVINQETKRIRKSQRELRRKAWWPLVTPRDVGVGNVGWQTETSNVGKHLINFSGFFQSGQESLRRFSQLVASQNLQMLIVFFLPARFLLVEMFASVIFQ